MSVERRKASKWTKLNPKCVFCDLIKEYRVILNIEENTIVGWRCPKCGFALIHPYEIPKAMKLLKESMKLKM